MGVFKKIGEKFKHESITLVVVEDENQDIKSCKDCAAIKNRNCSKDLPDCVRTERSDEKNVHFKIVE